MKRKTHLSGRIITLLVVPEHLDEAVVEHCLCTLVGGLGLGRVIEGHQSGLRVTAERHLRRRRRGTGVSGVIGSWGHVTSQAVTVMPRDTQRLAEGNSQPCGTSL